MPTWWTPQKDRTVGKLENMENTSTSWKYSIFLGGYWSQITPLIPLTRLGLYKIWQAPSEGRKVQKSRAIFVAFAVCCHWKMMNKCCAFLIEMMQIRFGINQGCNDGRASGDRRVFLCVYIYRKKQSHAMGIPKKKTGFPIIVSKWIDDHPLRWKIAHVSTMVQVKVYLSESALEGFKPCTGDLSRDSSVLAADQQTTRCPEKTSQKIYPLVN